MALFFASLLSVYPCLRLSNRKGVHHKWWVGLPFLLLICFTAATFANNKISLDHLFVLTALCGLSGLFLVHLCGMVKSIELPEIDPTKPIFLPLPK
jgi:hypothetical protein